VTSTTAETYLGRPLARAPSIDEVVLRYFGAFGPASVADVSAWSRLTGMREVVERLRRRLRRFRTEGGREMFDLPDAPRPDPGTPAPPRFLPTYDNVLLSHDDRSRFESSTRRGPLAAEGRPVHGTVLSDGLGVGTWWLETTRSTGVAALEVNHAAWLSKRAASAMAAEGRRMLRLIAAGATEHDVRLRPLD
jgi:hypothetical protein